MRNLTGINNSNDTTSTGEDNLDLTTLNCETINNGEMITETITTNDILINQYAFLDGSIKANNQLVSPTEISYLKNCTSNIQNQINTIQGQIPVDVVTTNTNQTITALKTFNTLPQSSATVANDADLTTKYYVRTVVLKRADDAYDLADTANKNAGKAQDTADGAIGLIGTINVTTIPAVYTAIGVAQDEVVDLGLEVNGRIDINDDEIAALEGKTQYQTANGLPANPITNFSGTLSCTNFTVSYINGLPYSPFSPTSPINQI